MEPKEISNTDCCLVYFHGGGFLFPAAGYHYRLSAEYVKQTPCKVVFVQYRLTPKHPFPIPAEDCFAAYCWTVEHADALGIDRNKIAVGGDSAGGALAAAVAQMTRDRNVLIPCFQLLIYPVTDRHMNSPSNQKYTDTPMWNSQLSVKMWEAYLKDKNTPDIAYASPLEAESFCNLPLAYVETAEFDCLHDEGITYAEALRAAGVMVEISETQGTLHGFDIVQKSPTTQRQMEARIQYMKKHFK